MNRYIEFLKKDDICAICIGKESNSYHCGIIYKLINSNSSNSFMIHLTLPKRVANEIVSEENNKMNYKWDSFKGIPEEVLLLISTKCYLVYNKNKDSGINYGILFHKDSHFDALGNLILGDLADGLTCSSFVLAILKSVGLNLIEITDWPENRDDNGYFIDYLIEVCEDSIIKIKDKIQKQNIAIKLSKNNTKNLLLFQRQRNIDAIKDFEDLLTRLNSKEDDLFQRIKPTEIAGLSYEDSNRFPISFSCKNGMPGAWILGEQVRVSL